MLNCCWSARRTQSIMRHFRHCSLLGSQAPTQQTVQAYVCHSRNLPCPWAWVTWKIRVWSIGHVDQTTYDFMTLSSQPGRTHLTYVRSTRWRWRSAREAGEDLFLVSELAPSRMKGFDQLHHQNAPLHIEPVRLSTGAEQVEAPICMVKIKTSLPSPVMLQNGKGLQGLHGSLIDGLLLVDDDAYPVGQLLNMLASYANRSYF